MSICVRQHIASETSVKAIKFITCYLLPPPKKAVLAALGIALTPGGKPEAPTEIIRKAEADVSYNRSVFQSQWHSIGKYEIVLGCCHWVCSISLDWQLVLMLIRDAYNVVIAFKNAKWAVETFEKLPEGTQPQISVQELIKCEEIVKKDPTVQKLAKDVGSYAQFLCISQVKLIPSRDSSGANIRGWMVHRLRCAVSSKCQSPAGDPLCPPIRT